MAVGGLAVGELAAVEEGGASFFHGTDAATARSLLGGAPLDAAAAAARKIDGKPGFFLAAHADDAAYFALRRGEGAVLKYHLSDVAVRRLGGLPTTALGRLGTYGQFLGGEAVVSVDSFGTFNDLLSAGEIKISPVSW